MRDWRPDEPDPRLSIFRFPLRVDGGGQFLDRPIIAFDIETTGLNGDEDRIVEVAIVRLASDGSVEDEWASLVDPGCDVGPTFIHHITNQMVMDAPTVGDLLGDIFPRLEGGVIVSHHAAFEEKFLRNEFRRLGVASPGFPAVCTLDMALEELDLVNHRLPTCCEHVGIAHLHTGGALGDARVKAQLAHYFIHRLGLRPRWDVDLPTLPRYPVRARARTRVTSLRKGDRGWMAGVIAKLPIATGVTDPPEADAYLEALASALADGKLTGDEAKALARMAGRAGLGARELDSLHRRFLDGLQESALDDHVLERHEYAELQRNATLLGLPDYVDALEELVVGPVTEPRPVSSSKEAPHEGRVWCSPAIDATQRDRLRAAGINVVANLSKTVAVMLVAEADQHDARVQRGRREGRRIVPSGVVAEMAERHELDGAAPFSPPLGQQRARPPWLDEPGGPIAVSL